MHCYPPHLSMDSPSQKLIEPTKIYNVKSQQNLTTDFHIIGNSLN